MHKFNWEKAHMLIWLTALVAGWWTPVWGSWGRWLAAGVDNGPLGLSISSTGCETNAERCIRVQLFFFLHKWKILFEFMSASNSRYTCRSFIKEKSRNLNSQKEGSTCFQDKSMKWSIFKVVSSFYPVPRLIPPIPLSVTSLVTVQMICHCFFMCMKYMLYFVPTVHVPPH